MGFALSRHVPSSSPFGCTGLPARAFIMLYSIQYAEANVKWLNGLPHTESATASIWHVYSML
jgi:hypothetical protein